jgi:hypothetical protein
MVVLCGGGGLLLLNERHPASANGSNTTSQDSRMAELLGLGRVWLC